VVVVELVVAHADHVTGSVVVVLLVGFTEELLELDQADQASSRL